MGAAAGMFEFRKLIPRNSDCLYNPHDQRILELCIATVHIGPRLQYSIITSVAFEKFYEQINEPHSLFALLSTAIVSERGGLGSYGGRLRPEKHQGQARY
jgi:hypothetical protein